MGVGVVLAVVLSAAWAGMVESAPAAKRARESRESGLRISLQRGGDGPKTGE